MATFRFRYAAGDPPVPSVLLNLFHPTTGQSTRNVAGIVDTGADQTVLPEPWITILNLPRLDQELVQGFDGSQQILPTFVVQMQLRDFPPFDLEVIASPRTGFAIVGRDVINRFKLTLDGPSLLHSVSDD